MFKPRVFFFLVITATIQDSPPPPLLIPGCPLSHQTASALAGLCWPRDKFQRSSFTQLRPKVHQGLHMKAHMPCFWVPAGGRGVGLGVLLPPLGALSGCLKSRQLPGLLLLYGRGPCWIEAYLGSQGPWDASQLTGVLVAPVSSFTQVSGPRWFFFSAHCHGRMDILPSHLLLHSDSGQHSDFKFFFKRVFFSCSNICHFQLKPMALNTMVSVMDSQKSA